MPVRYELRLGADTITGTSSPTDQDGLSSTIRIDAPTSIYLFIQANKIFATAEIDGNLEIFTFDQSTLIIENYFTTAAGSRIYTQNDDDIHSHSEYIIFKYIEEPTNHNLPENTADEDQTTDTESTSALIDSAKKSPQDAKIAKHHFEQALYRELFKKDNFSSSQYKISYDQSTKTYIANDIEVDFLKIAKNNLEKAEEDFNESNDSSPEMCLQMLNNAIDLMASDDISKMLFREDGTISYGSYFMNMTGSWEFSICPTEKNYLQAVIFAGFTPSEDTSPVFSAVEILNIRDKKKNAFLDFERSHGNANEQIFNFSNAAYEAEKTHTFSNNQKSFISEIKSAKNIDSKEAKELIEITEKIKSLFPDKEKTISTYGVDFQKSLDLLEKHLTLKSNEKLAQDALDTMDETVRIELSRNEVATNFHLNNIKEKEINEQHYKCTTEISKILDNIKEIELNFLRENDDEDHHSFDQPMGSALMGIDGQFSTDDGAENNDHADHVGLSGLTPSQSSAAFHPY